MSLSKREGAAEIFVCNLFAYRATDPRDLRAAAIGEFDSDPEDVVGPENYGKIMSQLMDADVCIVGWGNGGSFKRAGRHLIDKIEREFNSHLASDQRVPIMCLGVTKHGHPRHPLYVSNKNPLTPFSYAVKNDDGVEF